MGECVFCHKEQIITDFVYEDEFVMAFMDMEPINEGHILLVPKQHYLDVDEEVGKFTGMVIAVVYRNDDVEEKCVVAEEEKQQKGCIDIKYMKRFYVFDDIKEQPRELTRIVKCVKYFSCWDFDNMENYSNATHWYFEKFRR